MRFNAPARCSRWRRKSARRVEHAKGRFGALDFQDLIDKTLALLSRGDAAWVLYKLDRGIDHVLIDEAQDTNPEQWEILHRITADFTAGFGARGGRVRTLFAVGDPKQSIFGFQGAAPRKFEDEPARLEAQGRRSGTCVRRCEPDPVVPLDAGGAVCRRRHVRGPIPTSRACRSTTAPPARCMRARARSVPGRVELWPVVIPQVEAEPDAWVLPVDAPEQQSPPVVVAGRIADHVRSWTTTGDETGRVWKAGDVLVLVRKRGAAFEAVIRALKEKGVPVAGADRLNIGEHIAVMDLVAAGRAALLPDDDLTLATALKSPLVGLTDDDLIRIAAYRGDDESLLCALERHAADDDVAARRACAALRRWRELARERSPFGFYAVPAWPHGRESRTGGAPGERSG